MKKANKKYDRPKDANAKRKRISIDEKGKPLLKASKNEAEISPADFKLSSLDDE